MQSVYLVQRLQAPRAEINPFAFGGGLVNGGFGVEATSLLKGIFSFDYMGSAEFEWGAVPMAIKTLANDSSHIKFSMNIAGKDVYVICPSAIKEDVSEWIKKAAEGEFSGRLKERLGFKETLEGRPYHDFKGWLKIEEDKCCKEPFMFFLDKVMFENTCKLFGI